MNFRKQVEQNQVAVFIILTLGLSILAFGLPVPKEGAFTTIALVLITFPTIVALSLVALIEGRRGLGAFLREVFRWRVAVKWVGIAFVLGFVIHFGSSVLALATGRISTIQIAAPNAMVIAVFPLALLEEIGWRGFALRRLLERHSPFAALLMTGIPWALLHFALFLYFVPEVSAVAEMLVVLTFAVPLTWIYVKSGRNVLVATVLHGALNAFGNAGASIPPGEVLWFVFASACIVDAFLILLDRRMWFGHPAVTSVGQPAPSAV